MQGEDAHSEDFFGADEVVDVGAGEALAGGGGGFAEGGLIVAEAGVF